MNLNIEWLGKIPDSWQIKKINALYKLRNEKVSDYDYKPLSVSMKGVVPQLESTAKSDDHDNRKLVRKGDFAINSRSDRRNACGISDRDGSVSLINIVLQPRDIMNPNYYNWLFHTDQFADEFYKWGHGIVDDLWTTRWNDMKNILIPYPPLEEQKRIASWLDEKCTLIDAAIDADEKEIEKLKAYKQSVIINTVTKGLNPDVEMKDSGIEWIGDYPRKWKLMPVKYLVKISNGSDPKLEGSIPVYGSGTSSFKSCGEYKMGPAVLLGRKGSISIPNYVEGKYWNVDTAFDAKTKDHRLNLKFYYYCAVCFDYESYITQTTIPSMTQTDYGNMRIPFPERDEQEMIVKYLDQKVSEISGMIKIKQDQVEKLNAYKKSVIYTYVTGKKEVPNG